MDLTRDLERPTKHYRTGYSMVGCQGRPRLRATPQRVAPPPLQSEIGKFVSSHQHKSNKDRFAGLCNYFWLIRYGHTEVAESWSRAMLDPIGKRQVIFLLFTLDETVKVQLVPVDHLGPRAGWERKLSCAVALGSSVIFCLS